MNVLTCASVDAVISLTKLVWGVCLSESNTPHLHRPTFYASCSTVQRAM